MKRRAGLAAALAVIAALAACGEDHPSATPTAAAPAAMASPAAAHDMDHTMRDKDRAAAMLATAGFQDVATAEAAGYASSLDTLGCFQDPAKGGMGLHYINQSLLDANLDITKPEALVYELDAEGHLAGLVAHEYIVPIEAWHGPTPPALFGVPFHEHPTLPLWVLHAWLWKDNPTGVFEDWNPAVRLCPAGVPIFGTDLPAPAPTEPSTPTSPPDVDVEAASELRLEPRLGPH
jgi:predicted small lipoprotein YifL